MSKRKPLLCRLGFHNKFTDSIGDIMDVGEYKMITWKTYTACNDCDYRTRRYLMRG